MEDWSDVREHVVPRFVPCGVPHGLLLVLHAALRSAHTFIIHTRAVMWLHAGDGRST